MHLLTGLYVLGLSWSLTSAAIRVVPGSYIVKFDSSSYTARKHASIHAEFYKQLQSYSINSTIIREYDDPIYKGVVIELNNDADLPKLVEIAGAEFVKPLHFGSPSIEPKKHYNETKQKRNGYTPWPLAMIGADTVHEQGFFGDGITIGIIDSGVDYTHPALGAGFGPGKKVIGGYDFVGDAFTGEPDSPAPQPSEYPLDQCNGHGTSAAGVIGADPGHQPGVVGVAYEAKLRAYRIGGCTGGFREDIIIAALLRANRDGNDIITYSVVGYDEWSHTSFANVLNDIAANGRVVTMATGNLGRRGAWMAAETGSDQGVIAVGHVLRLNVAPTVENSRGAMVSSISSYGPSVEAGMSVAIAAPGEDVLSTWPRPLGDYIVDTGTSVATPIVAGAVALWLSAKGKSRTNARAVRSIFQSTALPMPHSARPGFLLDTVAHQGAGLLQIDRAVFERGSMSPTELELKDTMHAKLDWRIYITNPGRAAIRYELIHEPAGTARTIDGIECILGPLSLFRYPATIIDMPSEITVPAGRAKSFSVRFSPPMGLDPTTFPVYSGYIRATARGGSMLRSTYIGIAASMKSMKILDNTDRFLGVKLPHIKRGNAVISGPTTFTMQGNDIPVLWYRRVGFTPLMRIDLIDAGATVATNQRRSAESSEANTFEHVRRSPIGRVLNVLRECSFGTTRTRSKGGSRGSRGSRGRSRAGSRGSGDANTRSDSPESGLASGRAGGGGGRRGHGSFRIDSRLNRQCRVIGTLFERRHYQRGTSVPGSRATARLRVDNFANGRRIPDGSYKVLMRLLKNFGDPGIEEDYETWLSPQIDIHRV